MREKSNISQYDKMTKTPIAKLIVILSIPTTISMLVTNIYNLVDTAFVGRLGTSASGAVGIVFGFMSIIQAFGFMFGQGSGSILSRELGKKEGNEASKTATLGFLSSFSCGLLITLFGFIFIDWIIDFLGSTPTIFPYAKKYITWILIAAPFMTSSLTLNNILRYQGKATLGMIGLMAGAVLNIIGDPIFMFIMRMGISGAGLSTALSQAISWSILMFMFVSGRTETKLGAKRLKTAKPKDVLNIALTGFPSLLRQGLNSIVTIVLNLECRMALPLNPDPAIAAMSIVNRIIFFAFSVAVGIGQGFQPISGFNYGAEKFKRLRKAYAFTILISEIIIVVGCTIILIFAPELVRLLRNDPEVVEIGSRALRLQALSYMVIPFCMATEMLFQSTGLRIGATILSSFRSGLLFIPLLFILARTRGLYGIEEAQPLALLLSFPLTLPFAIHFFKMVPNTDKDDSKINRETIKTVHAEE